MPEHSPDLGGDGLGVGFEGLVGRFGVLSGGHQVLGEVGLPALFGVAVLVGEDRGDQAGAPVCELALDEGPAAEGGELGEGELPEFGVPDPEVDSGVGPELSPVEACSGPVGGSARSSGGGEALDQRTASSPASSSRREAGRSSPSCSGVAGRCGASMAAQRTVRRPWTVSWTRAQPAGLRSARRGSWRSARYMAARVRRRVTSRPGASSRVMVSCMLGPGDPTGDLQGDGGFVRVGPDGHGAGDPDHVCGERANVQGARG